MAKTIYSGTQNVPLSVAVFLASDSYDHNPNPNTISATSLLRSTRQVILGNRESEFHAPIDLGSLVASRIGTAIHDGIERAWQTNYRAAMASLGYPKGVIDSIVINPDPNTVTEGQIPIYMENRHSKRVGKWVVTGKYDIVIDGRLEDFKTTGVFTAMNNSRHEDFKKQGSIYRWLAPEIITQDTMAIQYLFTDWSALRARSEANYPKSRHQELLINLDPVHSTERFVFAKLAELEKYWDSPEHELPPCNATELWQSDPVFKYYKNPEKMSRSTKNYATRQEANKRLSEEGGIGVVIEQAGQAVACKYCSAFSLCTQKDQLIAAGELVI